MPSFSLTPSGPFPPQTSGDFGRGIPMTWREVTENYTLVAEDAFNAVAKVSDTASITISLPTDEEAPDYPIGAQTMFLAEGTDEFNCQIVFVANTGAVVNYQQFRTNQTAFQYSIVFAVKRAANHWILYGDLSGI